MSIFDDIAHAIGHTIDSLAQDVGADVHLLEGVVNELASNGIEVLSAAAKLGLSPVRFLRGIVDIMNGDPHQRLLSYMTTSVKRMDDPLHQLPQQWSQMVNLHQDTAQTIDAQIKDLFQSGGAYSYSGPAADTLWTTHQNYQQYFTVLVDHAQTQQTRYTTLSGHTDDYLSQMNSKVYSLSTPMAALGVLSLDTVATSPPPVLDDPAVQAVEQWIGGTVQTGEQTEENDPDPEPVSHGIIFLIFAAIVIILVLILVIVVIVVAVRDAFQGHQSQQMGTKTPQPTLGPSQPTNLNAQQTQTAKELYNEFGGDIPLSEIEQMIRDHPQWSKDKLRQELLRKQLREGKGLVSQLVGKTVTLSPGQTKTFTADDVEAMIKAGYTNTLFAVLLGLRPLSDATTPEGRPLTWHALADSIPRHGISLQEIDAVIDNPSRTSVQTDGGIAYIKSTKQGYSLVIVNSNGQIVTALKNLTPSQLKQLGRNYGFDPNP